ncbi:MAG TPA: hypothetical protein ENN21_05490 [Spirochaetes bacterium]|nr:hypothetical protein [Spirochaetota bacterium]
MPLFGKKSTPEEKFWKWFMENDERLYGVREGQEPVIKELLVAIRKVHPDLTFEFGPVEAGNRSFTISAGGLKEVAPAVEKLYAAAPKLSHWTFYKYRQRRPLQDVRLGKVNLRPADVLVTIEEDGPKAGLGVYIKGYKGKSDQQKIGAAFLMLDEALGEYDVMMKVGFIEFYAAGTPTDLVMHNMETLPVVFDNFFQRN